MDMDVGLILRQISIWALPVLFAITLHEAAHAWVALKLGDRTAYAQGRVTLNPIAHIDPVGTVILPLLTLTLGGMVFGWAKPVPVNYFHLRNIRRDPALVALAGPGANFLMAIAWAIVARIGFELMGDSSNSMFEYLIYTGRAGIVINLVLMALNLLPILPLDGGRIVNTFLPDKLAKSYEALEPYGLLILLVLLLTGVLSIVLSPVITTSLNVLWFLVGL